MDSNSRLWLFLHHNQLTSPLFLFHFSLVCSCLSDIQQWWKFKALMMGRLSDPPKQLDGMSERLCEFVKTLKMSLPFVGNLQMSTRRRVVCLIFEYAQSKRGRLFNHFLLLPLHRSCT